MKYTVAFTYKGKRVVNEFTATNDAGAKLMISKALNVWELGTIIIQNVETYKKYSKRVVDNGSSKNVTNWQVCL